MKKFFVWAAGFFEDQAGSASSKRAVLYVCMYFLWLVVRGSLAGKSIDQTVLFTIAGLILFCVGAITSEMLMKMYETKEDKTKSETTKTETVKTETTKPETP